MGIYDLNTAQQVVELLPPDKRYLTTVKWIQTLLKSTVQWLRDRVMNDYRAGSSAPIYTSGTYDYGVFVQFQKGVYVSLVSNNTALPNDVDAWYKIQDNFVGLNERILYNGQKIILEYALNKWFNTVFRQPNVGLSDIYLTTNAQPVSPFISGGNNSNSSLCYANKSTEFCINEYSFDSVPNLTINVPLAVYNSLSDNDTNRTNLVRSFTDKYITAGILYNIQTYA